MGNIMEISKYLETITQANHYAGGGSVASLNGALAASLILKAYNMIKKKDEGISDKLRPNFENNLLNYQKFFEIGIEEDGKIFGNVLEAWKLSKDTEEERIYRFNFTQNALKAAVNSPYKIMEKTVALLSYILEISKFSDDMILTELIVASHQISSAYNSASINFYINLKYIKDKKYIVEMKDKHEKLQKQFEMKLTEFNTK